MFTITKRQIPRGNCEVLNKIIDEALDKNNWEEFRSYQNKNKIEQCIRYGNPIIFSIFDAPSEIVIESIENGVPINVKNKRYLKTPLYYTSSLEVHKKLLQKGVNVNNQDWNGQTAAYYLISEDPELLNLHIQKGLNLNLSDLLGQTVLFEASKFNFPNIIKLIIENGGYIDFKDNFGMTPLFHALNREMINNVKMLLKFGASKDVKIKEFCEEAPNLKVGSSMNDLLDLKKKRYYDKSDFLWPPESFIELEKIFNM